MLLQLSSLQLHVILYVERLPRNLVVYRVSREKQRAWPELALCNPFGKTGQTGSVDDFSHVGVTFD